MEKKTCKHCQTSFDITDKDLEFYDKVSPTFAGKKYSIPAPTFCPDCRTQRRLSFGNERKLYRRKCDLTDKGIISIYSPNKPYKVYETKERRSDKWDPMEYGKEIDFSSSFLKQYSELHQIVPMMSLFTDSNENSEYVNYSGWDKNCYLCVCVDFCENSYYCYNTYYSKYTTDCTYSYYLEHCYDCIDCKNCFKVFHSQNCMECNDSYFLYNCVNCRNCFGCVDMVNTQYCFINKVYEKDEYEKKVSDFKQQYQNNHSKMQQAIKELFTKTPVRGSIGTGNENTSGNYLFNCKECFDCFDSMDLENAKFCSNIKGGKNFMDVNRWGNPGELLYECMGVGSSSNQSAFNLCSRGSLSQVYYCIGCINNCSNLFGCVGLRNKQYCILNKQYTKAEYEMLVPQIIENMIKAGERGEFFNPSMSPFGYNETLAVEHFPLTKDEALKQGFKRSDYEAPFPQVEKILKTDEIPDIQNIDANGESPVFSGNILQQAIVCEVSKKPFRIIKPELDFYRKHNLSLPTKHPDIRHAQRMVLRNPRKLRDRKCMKCSADIKTTYAPERPETVYCETCYNKEIYG